MSSLRATTLLVLLVLAIGALLFTAPGSGYWVIDPDAAAYVGLGRSLAAGDGYTLQGVPHAKFPAGFPALIAAAIRFTDDRECYAAMRDIVTFFGILDVVLAFLVARRVLKLSSGASLFVAFSAAVSVYVLQYAVAYLRSETMFTAFYLAALLAGESWRERQGFRGALATGVLAAGAIAVRSAGLAAIAGLALARVLAPGDTNRVRIDLAPRTLLQIAIMSLIGIAPMLVQKFYVASRCAELGVESSDYGDEFYAPYALDLTKNVDEARPRIALFSAEMAERVKGNLGSLALSLGKFTANHNKGANLAVGSRSGALHPGGILLLCVLILGIVLAARARMVVATATSVVYLGLYLIWPFDQQQRFYQPIACLLLPLLAFGARPLLSIVLRIASSARGRVVIGCAALAVATMMGLVTSDVRTVLGRWSLVYALLIGGTATFGFIALASAAWRRLAHFDLPSRQPIIERAALGLLALMWVGSFVGSLRDLRVEHDAFVASRKTAPVSAPFARIKTNPELVELLEKLLAEARPGDLVMSDIPKMIHEMTGLATTPLRFDSAKRTLVLDTEKGRPTLLYHSPEIPRVLAIVGDYIDAHPGEFAVIHRVVVTEGSLTIPLALFRITPSESN